MLIDGSSEPKLEVLGDEQTWHRMLGSSLGLAVGATFFLQVAANENAGWFDLEWLDRADMEPIFEHWPREVIERRVIDLSSTVPQFKAAYDSVPKPPRGMERYAYNPLGRRPFLRMPDGRFLAPQPRLILRTISPGGLYYVGVDEFGTAFARDLGHLTESYVGRQLSSFGPSVVLHPEVVYSKQNLKSIDWFLVLPSVVVMFEVKSARFGLLERAGVDGFESRSKELLDHAYKQLRRTSEALDARRPEFVHIPSDRPRIGIVVTGEPHYLSNSPWMRNLVVAAPFPTLVASMRELEHLVGLPLEEVERQLVAITSDPERSTWNLGSALTDADSRRRNLLLDKAWSAYPWLGETD